MTGTFLWMVAIVLAVGLWDSARKSAERAREHALAACQRSGVQLLDHTVSLRRLAVRRDSSGWLRLERIYSFDYSSNGADRQQSELALRGVRLQWLREPTPREGA